MFGGFKKFILRGNIVDLAVGVVIGVAFNGLVMGFTADFINPLIKVVSGGKALAGTFTVRHQVFHWADFINSVINFVLIAAVLYFFVVMPMNRMAERRQKNLAAGKPEPAEEAPSDEVVLLTQIRDALLVSAAIAGGPADASADASGGASAVGASAVGAAAGAAADGGTGGAVAPEQRTGSGSSATDA